MLEGFVFGDKWVFSSSQLDLPYIIFFSYQMQQVLKESETKAVGYSLQPDGKALLRKTTLTYVIEHEKEVKLMPN